MKGILIIGGRELITKQYGKDVWEKAKDLCGFDRNIILPMKNVDDEKILCMGMHLSRLTHTPVQKIWEDFGFAWTSKIAPKEYPTFFKNYKNLYEFLKNINYIHKVATSNMQDAHPPTFKIETPSPRELIMEYISERHLIPLAKGAILGAADYYNEKISLSLTKENIFQIIFL